MTRLVPVLLVLGSLFPGCDTRQSIEQDQLARFPQGQIFEDDEDPRHNAGRGLPKCLRVDLPVIGRGVCVPVAVARPDGAHDALRSGIWTYAYVKAELRVSKDGHEGMHFGDLEDTSLGLEARGEYVDDKYQGPWMFWHPNGKQRAFGVFVDSEMSGEWNFWFPDGSVDAVNSGVYERNVRQASSSKPK